MEYNAWKFAKLAKSEFGNKLWEFLNKDKTFIRMETASRLKRPAVEGIAEDLKIKFNKELCALNNSDYLRFKQMIGHMVKQVMYYHNYSVFMKNVRVISTDLFSKGTRYKKNDVMEFNKSYRLCQTLNFASYDLKLKNCIKNWCKKNSKNFICSEPNTTDVFMINSFIVIADLDFMGTDTLATFRELEKEKLFALTDYEDKEKFELYKKSFGLDENGKLMIEPTELILTNEFDSDEIISKLDKFVEIYKNNFIE
ncbi:MAG: hypothetical protein K8S23_04465 [Candidatus Cloacimonetes bacterium]|nr:hypothetical protein [Candidatus Cloacimonadota bacterium]